ncbi:family 20 glycosylhydrolase [Pararcticibacter amylolyticus]|uniref:beta-N-acetylhexosaminidase n=1 Tax=Pararcticibacter amylolyticus TaxID=2173175 RepID=A0A2U2PL09_9SPHI|nr:family 20 glycosylhydrolase [Pararcticibacter amylolyticus]PWG81952.1 beta-N-acetylhexosaminidase [Pararcticibacter amylolyticus]
MKFFSILFTGLLLYTANVFGQLPAGSLPEISLSWQPLQNRYQGGPEALGVLEISNTGDRTLPAEGWKLYFNMVRVLRSKEQEKELLVKHVNGDLFYLYPAKTFGGLKPGQTVRIELLVNGSLVIASDTPQGFYLVADAGKQIRVVKQFKVLPAADPVKLQRFEGDEEISPAKIYAQNASLKDIPLAKLTKIFPTPVQYTEKAGSFILTANTAIQYDETFEQEAGFLADRLLALLGKPVKLSKNKNSFNNNITLQKDTLRGEAYSLTITSGGIRIGAGTAAGAFYAVQSLLSLIDPPAYASAHNKKLLLPCAEVKDHPRFAYRAVMLDVARNFHPKQQVLKMIDLMALYKLNTLHLHLNDDEGWRIEIPALPELTEVGGRRAHLFEKEEGMHLPPSYGSGPYAGQLPGSGYYSRAEFIEILRYAKQRHISVLPEIETPGHARAAIRAMDSRYFRLMKEGKKEEAERFLLHDFNDSSVYRSVQKWNDNVMDVSKHSVYNFLGIVTDELTGMYKEAGAALTTIHLGGDEVPAGVWEKSPSYAKLKMVNPGIQSTDDLWYYYFGKADSLLKKRGLYLSGWEEVAMRKTKVDGTVKWIPNPDFNTRNFRVNVWNNLSGNEDLAYKLANAGYKVVLSFVTNFYLDMAYHKSFEEQSFYWGGFTELDKPFSFIPFNYLKNQRNDNQGRPLSINVINGAERLTDYGRQNVAGLQGLLWTETVKTSQQMEYQVLPRMLSLAEKAWSRSRVWEEEPDSAKAAQLYQEDLQHFYNVSGKRELKRLDYYAGGFDYRIAPPGLKRSGNLVYANTQLPGFTIRYTTDGSMPGSRSKVYTGPLAYNSGLVFRAFSSTGRGSRISKPDNSDQ